MLVAVVVVTSIGALSLLEEESGSYLIDTGSDIGTPRELAADLDPDLPTAPAWLTQPPPPTTTTTAPPTTTTSSTPSSSSSSSSSSTPSSSTSSSTTAPPAAIVFQGPVSNPLDASQCYEARDPGIAGSVIRDRNCNGGDEQVIVATGTATEVVITFNNAANAGFCFQEDGGRVILASCDGSDKQIFDVVDNGDGTDTLISRSSGLCVAGEGRLRLFACDGNATQKFAL